MFDSRSKYHYHRLYFCWPLSPPKICQFSIHLIYSDFKLFLWEKSFWNVLIFTLLIVRIEGHVFYDLVYAPKHICLVKEKKKIIILHPKIFFSANGHWKWEYVEIDFYGIKQCMDGLWKWCITTKYVCLVNAIKLRKIKSHFKSLHRYSSQVISVLC